MPAKSTPFTLRLSAGLDRLISAEARRTKRSKGAVLESLADEALRCRRFPGIAFRGSDADRRAWVIGSALDVWEVIEALQDFGSAERMVSETDLTERQIRVAMAYHREFTQEIDDAIAENRRSLHDLSSCYPTLYVRAAESR